MTEEQKSNDEVLAASGAPEIQIVTPSALEALQRAEVDVAIATAKKYPRDIALSIKTAKELALRNAKIAATCNYALPRGGKKLVGPSVHFARIVNYAWRNSTAVSRVIGCDRANAHLQGVFHDLESNVRVGFEMDWPVQPPHTDTPARWNDQMNLAKRAGAAVALRTAIFNVIPLVLFEDIAEEAKRVALGGSKTFAEQRATAIGVCKELGITQPMIYRALEVGGLESINTDHLIWLHAALQSIRDGTMTREEVFGREKDVPVRARVPRTRNEGGRYAAQDPKEEQLQKKNPKAADTEAHPSPPLPGMIPSDLLAQIATHLSSSQIDSDDFLAFLKTLGVIPKTATDLSAAPPHVAADIAAHWDDTLFAYSEWRLSDATRPASQ